MAVNDKRKMNSVSKAIRDVISAINIAEQRLKVPSSESLTSHLSTHIKTGLHVFYSPIESIDWRVETDPD